MTSPISPAPKGSHGAPHGIAVFAYGFRPFFLLAGVYGALAVLGWLAHLAGLIRIESHAGAMAWHGHEMLFGFATAVLAGFMLTAVPNWTGDRALHDGPLILLAGIWVVGRIGQWSGTALPASLVAVMDLLFLPALALAIAPALYRAGKARNFMFPVALLLLLGCNIAYHLDGLGLVIDGAFRGQIVALDMFALMIAVVGGRIVPSFTSNALRLNDDQSEVVHRPRLDMSVIGTMILLVLLDATGADARAVGAVAIVAGGLNGVRLVGWHGVRMLGQPIVAVLHVGYAWLVAGLLAKGAGAFGVLPPTTALHALAIGAIGTMTLAVMSRAALGHTGRPLVVAPATVAAYGLVSAAALVRILAPPLFPQLGAHAFAASGLLWSLAFICFTWVYAPILIRPRLDGQPG